MNDILIKLLETALPKLEDLGNLLCDAYRKNDKELDVLIKEIKSFIGPKPPCVWCGSTSYEGRLAINDLDTAKEIHKKQITRPYIHENKE